MTQKLVISTAGASRSGEIFDRLALSEAISDTGPARPQPETLRHRHHIQSRQTRARRVIHHRRIK